MSLLCSLGVLCWMAVVPHDDSAHSTAPAATETRPTPNPRLVGGWFARTEVDGKTHGHWLELAADGTWRRIEDYFGFRAENSGRWLPDADGVVLEDLGVRLHLLGGKLILVFRGETLYAFEPCPTMPKEIGELPPFPRTLSETVAILSAELAEPERTMIAGTLAQDLPRFHHGLGTYIRNHFGLWGPNPALLAACKVEHPEDASDVILRALRTHLRHTTPGGRALDELERVLTGLVVARIPVRRMTLAQFLTAINQETRRSLRQKGLLDDAVVVELAPPENEDERQRRDRYWLSYPPGLRAWGQGARDRDGVSPVELLAGFKRWLKAPGRVILEPDFDPRWYQTPDRSPDFVSARWRDDWFEIETSIEPGAATSESIRVDRWSMLGEAPPMPVEQAAAYAGEPRERIPAGKELVELAVTGSRAQDTWEWEYQVRSRRGSGQDADFASYRDGIQAAGAVALSGRDLAPKSQWPDPRKPPRISLARALSLVRHAKNASTTAGGSVEIRLRRAGSSPYWYYRVVLHDADASTGGFVTLDGRVLAP